jgi:hypothetical protein
MAISSNQFCGVHLAHQTWEPNEEAAVARKRNQPGQ